MNPLSLDQAPHAVWRGDIPDPRAKIGSGPGPGALYRHFQGVTSARAGSLRILMPST